MIRGMLTIGVEENNAFQLTHKQKRKIIFRFTCSNGCLEETIKNYDTKMLTEESPTGM